MVAVRMVSDEARKVLARCQVEHDAITLPAGQLDRRLYQEVNSVLEALGGKWTRNRKAHIFTEPTGVELVESFYVVVETGSWERPQDVGYFPTPGWLVERMLEVADIESFHRVLEPSAGQGAILLPLAKKLNSCQQIAIYEILPNNRKALAANGFEVDGEDFMAADLEPLFDRVVMNPPFARSQGPAHVRRAMEMLKPGGRLVAILPNGIVQRQDRLHADLRREILMNGTIVPLPDDTFRDVGTMVRTVLVTYVKPAAKIQQVRTTAQPEQATSAPSRPQEPRDKVTVPVEPVRRFRRLTEPSRKFARPKRRQV